MKGKFFTLIFLAAHVAIAQTNWVKSPSNLVMTKSMNLYEGVAIGSPSVIDEGDTLKMLYAAGGTDTKGRISYAYSLNGTAWTKYNNASPIFDVSPSPSWDSHFLDTPDWIRDSTGYKMYYFGDNDNNAIGGAIGLAASNDGIYWVRSGTQPVLAPGNLGDWDGLYLESPSVLFDGVSYFMWYSGIDTTYQVKIGVATSADGVNWTKYAGNPVLDGGSIYSWEGLSVATPTIIKRNGLFEMWYCGVSYYDILDNNNIDTVKVGYASSLDGFSWTKYPSNPVMSTFDSPFSANDIRGPWTPDAVYRTSLNRYDMWYETAYGFGLATANDNLLALRPFYNPLEGIIPYPNPATEILTIAFSIDHADDEVIQIYNLQGQLVMESPIEQPTQINIAAFPVGLYLIRLKNRPQNSQFFYKQ